MNWSLCVDALISRPTITDIFSSTTVSSVVIVQNDQLYSPRVSLYFLILPPTAVSALLMLDCSHGAQDKGVGIYTLTEVLGYLHLCGFQEGTIKSICPSLQKGW